MLRLVSQAAQQMSENNGIAKAIVVDITDPKAVLSAIDETQSALGELSILVNNAGINGPTKPTWEYSVEEWQHVVNTDLVSVFICCHAILPRMIASKRGRIVNIASIAGKEGNAQISAYSAAKAGVIGFTKALAKELVPYSILVNCIAPGND